MPLIPRAALAGLLALASPFCVAQALWVCGLSDDAVRLVCVADADPTLPTAAESRPTAMVAGTSFPLDTRRQYSVELWTPPSDMEFVAQLARATICYRSPGCSVVMATERPVALVALRR
jgi:hypothetical protein